MHSLAHLKVTSGFLGVLSGVFGESCMLRVSKLAVTKCFRVCKGSKRVAVVMVMAEVVVVLVLVSCKSRTLNFCHSICIC